MNAWVLSVILCSAAPSSAGDYCQAIALRYGVTREACHAELEKWRDHPARPRLECTEDPGLVTFLAEQEDDGQVEIDGSDDDDPSR